MVCRFLRGVVPAIVLASLLAGCAAVQTSKLSRQEVEANARMESQSLFGAFQIARIPREVVAFNEKYKPGTIVVNSSQRRLYLVMEGGKALRYGIGVGRDGFRWSGVHTVTAKKEWPAWTPPPQMIARLPDLPRHMEGGPENPLGARAMYLGSSLYRIHGSNEEETIG